MAGDQGQILTRRFLCGGLEDLEAHEIEQSKPMSARELKQAEDDDSVKSKASKFDPNEEVSDSVS